MSADAADVDLTRDGDFCPTSEQWSPAINFCGFTGGQGDQLVSSPSSSTMHRHQESMGRKSYTKAVFLRFKMLVKVYSFVMLVSRHMLSTTAVTFRGSELPRGYFHSVTPP